MQTCAILDNQVCMLDNIDYCLPHTRDFSRVRLHNIDKLGVE